MKFICIFFTALLAVSNFLLAQEDTEELIVASAFIEGDSSSINNPIHVVEYAEVSKRGISNLGESIDSLLGVSNQDFGASVGKPIIRGMAGNRVKVLNNGLVVRDVAYMGADHPIEIDLNAIEQIEIVKGPSSILYSNGAIGGIVNVVDKTIAKEDILETSINVGFESQSVNDGDSYNINLSSNVSGFNIFLSHLDKNLDNFDIPDEAVIHEPGHTEEEKSFLPNSDSKLAASRAGLSKTGDWGYYGISFVNSDQLNGVPFHGEEHEPKQGCPEHEEERIFASTNSSVINVEGKRLLDGPINDIVYIFRETDSLLTEQHLEEEGHEEDPVPAGCEEEEEGPTTFTNNAEEVQLIFDISNDSLEQKVVFNYADQESSVIGSEAFMEPTDSTETTIGYYLGTSLNEIDVDFGIRFDEINRKGSIKPATGNAVTHDLDFDGLSYSASFGTSLTDNISAALGLSAVERAPSPTELFMNGKHLVIQRYEIGSVALNTEESQNIDLQFNFDVNGFEISALYFKNDIDNYIYLLDTATKKEEVLIANHSQRDAEFEGYELSIGSSFDLYQGELAVSVGTDSVEGKFTDGTFIPRITPSRFIYSFEYAQDDLLIDVSLTDVDSQSDVASGESVTNGFELLDLSVSKSFDLYGEEDLTLGIFGTNLLDEIARNHNSYVKNEVPLAGRNIGLRFNLSL